MRPAIVSGIVTGKLKQRPFWATQVNRKWIFQIVSMRVKAHYEEKASLPVDVRRSKTPSLLTNHGPLPGSKNPHFQNEAKCTTFLVKMSFICMRMKNLLHIKGWALNLVLIQRRGIGLLVNYYSLSLITVPEAFAEVSSAQFLLVSKSGEFMKVIKTTRLLT